MSDSAAQNVPHVFAGLLTEKEFEVQTGWPYRTRRRREEAGMPVIHIGIERFYDPVAVREWLLSQQSRRTTPKRGRPSKRAA